MWNNSRKIGIFNEFNKREAIDVKIENVYDSE